MTAGYNYFAGIPDSTLSPFILSIENNIIPHNEGGAIAAACGYYLSTGKTPVVYMQNSGLWNALNPLISIAILYGIPMLLIIGYRGQPGTVDAEAHIQDGEITEPVLKMLNIDYEILSDKTKIKYENKIKAILVPVGLLEGQKRKETNSNLLLGRDKAIEYILSTIDNDSKIISSVGYLSRELYNQSKDHKNNFYCIGGMGHASMVAVEIAKNTNSKVYLLDGDGSTLMHLGAVEYIAAQDIDNFVYIIFNNGCYDSVGAMDCISLDYSNLGIYYFAISDYNYLIEVLNLISKMNCKFIIEIFINPEQMKGDRPNNLSKLKKDFMDNFK